MYMATCNIPHNTTSVSFNKGIKIKYIYFKMLELKSKSLLPREIINSKLTSLRCQIVDTVSGFILMEASLFLKSLFKLHMCFLRFQFQGL